MQRIRATLSGFTGAPGLVTMYGVTSGAENGTTAQILCDRLTTAINHIVSTFPTAYTVTPDSFVDTIDAATGALTASVGVTPDTVTGGASEGYLATAVQVVANWKTDQYVNGRRVTGRTFFGPCSQQYMGTDGTPHASLLTALGLTADDWHDAGATSTFTAVWHRPVNGTGGSAHPITAHSTPDKYAVLRSRRD